MTVNWSYFRARTGETNEGWKAREKGSRGKEKPCYKSGCQWGVPFLTSLF